MAPRVQVAVAAALLVALLLSAAPAECAVTGCSQVMGDLVSCLSYARGMVSSPDGACCSGIKSLQAAAVSTADRQTACKCLKQQTSGIGGIKPDLVAGVPGKCGVNIPYAISASTDCNKVR